MGLGLLGSMVVGGIGGAGKGMAQVGQMNMENDLQMQRAQAIERLREQSAISAENRAESSRVAKNSAYKTSVDEMALSRAKQLYGKDGEGLTANDLADEEKTNLVSPSDRRKLAVDAGLLSYKDSESADYQEGRNQIMDDRYKAEAEDRRARADREERRLNMAEGKNAKAEADVTKVKSLMKKFMNAKAQGATKDMLEMIDADIVAAGGKSLMTKPEGSYDFSVVDSDEGKGVVVGNKKTGEAEFRMPKQMAKSDSSGIPPRAIEALKANPALKDDFDRKYGQGASAKYLGK